MKHHDGCRCVDCTMRHLEILADAMLAKAPEDDDE